MPLSSIEILHPHSRNPTVTTRDDPETVVRYPPASGKEREEVVVDVDKLQTIEVQTAEGRWWQETCGGGEREEAWGSAADGKERSARERPSERSSLVLIIERELMD